MKMRFVGKGVYHRGPGGIERPGDFGWAIHGAGVDEQGKPNGVLPSVEIALYCPRTGVCLQHVRTGPHGDADGRRYWHWDGNWESPTITPSIGCDTAPGRCSAHMVITAGEISGVATSWTRPPKDPGVNE